MCIKYFVLMNPASKLNAYNYTYCKKFIIDSDRSRSRILLIYSVVLKPGFHIIVGIAGIARIAEKLAQWSWQSQRSQRSTGFHMIAVIAENKTKVNHIEFICYVCPAIHPGILILVIFAKFIAQTVILQYSSSSIGGWTSLESHFKL